MKHDYGYNYIKTIPNCGPNYMSALSEYAGISEYDGKPEMRLYEIDREETEQFIAWAAEVYLMAQEDCHSIWMTIPTGDNQDYEPFTVTINPDTFAIEIEQA